MAPAAGGPPHLVYDHGLVMHPRSLLSCKSSARHSRLWAGVVLFVLLAQWLALVHTVLHGRGFTPVEARPGTASSWVERLAGHDAGSAACQVLDQLAQAAPPMANADTVLATVLEPAPLSRPPAPTPAQRCSAYRARAPPRLA